MLFDYNIYLRGNLIFPAIVIIFITITSITTIITNIKKLIKEKKKIDDLEANHLMGLLMAIAIPLIFYIHTVGPLSNGGIYLISEREKDIVVIEGYIDEIQYVEVGDTIMSKFPNQYRYGEYNAVLLNVNGDVVKGPSMILKEFETGDYVVISYLPKSGYILEIQSETAGETGDGSLSVNQVHKNDKE